MPKMACYGHIIFFLCAIILHFPVKSTAQVRFNYWKSLCVSSANNYTANSTFSTNLGIVLSSLSANATRPDRFYNATAGVGSDAVYGIFLCRGDTGPQLCQDCAKAASQQIVKGCPGRREALIWFDMCMVRYASRSIASYMEHRPRTFSESPTTIRSDPDGFRKILGDMLDRLVKRAVSGSGAAMFATEEVNVTDFRNLYGLVQCTPDISQHFCNVCLRTIIIDISSCCNEKEGARILAPSCNLRYESAPFFETNGTAVASSPPATSSSRQPSTSGNGSDIPRIALITVVSTVALMLFIILVWFFLWRPYKKKVKSGNEILTVESLQFNFSTIRGATDDFSNAKKLGRGGFGDVYKGVLPNGQEIAVKRLSKKTDQGEPEFKNEVLLLAKLQHRNLIRLLGFCLEGEERLLIYEFLPNSSLDHFIFDPVNKVMLDWERRHKIIRGIARGLLYLHEDSHLRIIHLDLKASNILLEADMNPKISDFGMAKLFPTDQTHANASRIAGTYGYMAPEYANFGHFSVKSDIYSFGVLILEIVSGQKTCFHVGENLEHLASYAWECWTGGRALDVMDPTLGTDSRNEIIRCLHIGLLCVQQSVADRPTMASVLSMLDNDSLELPVPSRPGFFMHGTTQTVEHNSQQQNLSAHSERSSAQFSVGEVSITALSAR